jgi:hypothetical protein
MSLDGLASQVFSFFWVGLFGQEMDQIFGFETGGPEVWRDRSRVADFLDQERIQYGYVFIGKNLIFQIVLYVE